MSKPIVPSTRELGIRYRRLLELAQAESVLDHGRLFRVLEHLNEEMSKRPKNERRRGCLTIPPHLALRFRESDLRGFRVRPDIYFAQAWCDHDGDDPFTELDLKLRVWVPGDASARPSLDNPDLESCGWRVGLRVHFDKHAPGQCTPRYHFQAGGKPEAAELCQLYEEICEPRVPMWPHDFALAIQIVLKGFFPVEYSRLVLKDEFRAIIQHSERAFVKPVQAWIGRYFGSGDPEARGKTLLEYVEG